jgi:DNA repair protein RecO (recombination protein O)
VKRQQLRLRAMTEKATGLILRTRPLTETSLIVHWLTPAMGRIATVAKGAHRPKSPFRGQLDLFYLAQLSFERSTRSQLHNLREVRLIETHRALREDLGVLQQASYCSRLVEQATEEETPLPAVFDLLLGLVRHMVSHPAQPRTIFAFELRLLDQLGLRPDLAQTRFSPGTKQLICDLLSPDWQGLGTLRANASQASELGQFLLGFLIHHLGKVPDGRREALLSTPASKPRNDAARSRR